MLGSVGGIVLGLIVGLRHAFEPDHLTAVSTLVTEPGGAKRGALLGAIWGIGHTASLIAVGLVLVIAGAALPDSVATAFELAVAAMLIGLGVRAVIRAARDTSPGPVRSLRPLLIGLVHGLAGSGALTALVFAALPDTTARLLYIALFGVGSIAGMALASGLAGATLRRLDGARRHLAYASGALSIVVGFVWLGVAA